MEKLEELVPVSQRVFLPERVCEGLDTSRPEVGAKADGGQVSKIGKESEDAGVRDEWMVVRTWTDCSRSVGKWTESQDSLKMK